MAVMFGIDPHKGSHTAVALDEDEQPLDGSACGRPSTRFAAAGVGGTVRGAHLGDRRRRWTRLSVAQQLLAAGERVVDVPAKLAAGVRLLATGDINKNDPNDARSVAVAALRSTILRDVLAEDHAAVMKVWAKRHRDLARHRTRVACRLHAVLCELVPGGFATEMSAARPFSPARRPRA